MILSAAGLRSFFACWICAAAAVLALSGCTSTPQASPERDADAKRFASHPGFATLYVYRPDFANDGADPALWIDNRLIGSTLPRTYFRIDLRPGKQALRAEGAAQGRFTIATAGGEVYFVRLSVYDGPAHFALVNPETAKKDLLGCCALLENWAPGQRPLLR